MINLPTAVRSDSLSAMGSTVAPGVIAAFPYVALIWGPPHNLNAFVDANQGASTAAGALLIVAVGLMVESIGSYVEYHVIDSRHPDRIAMQTRWREYLQIAWPAAEEPIGQHYLRRILTIFKFELNVLVASALMMPGIVLLAYYGVLPVHGLIWAAILSASLIWYLYRAAVASSLLLDSLRQDLITQARANGALKSGVESPTLADVVAGLGSADDANGQPRRPR